MCRGDNPSEKDSLKEQRCKVCKTDIIKGLGYGAFGIASLVAIGFMLKGAYDNTGLDLVSGTRKKWLDRGGGANSPKLEELLATARKTEMLRMWVARSAYLLISASLVYFNYEKEVIKNTLSPFKKLLNEG